ncbi:MAG: hypothetical protein LBH70_00645 [Spirochaetaceae bacterium]|jgi:hypothetical protein|nr:hypothetical protein [Spirochaetaceae bacterium]
MFGLGNQKKGTDPARFWKDYEEKCGEKVLAYTLGQYRSGWEEFDLPPRTPLWGLLIATSGGFRFHHFPHEGWIQTLARVSSGEEAPKEKTLFIPKDRMASIELKIEKSWLKKIFLPRPPLLVIRYGDAGGELVMEADQKARELVQALSTTG